MDDTDVVRHLQELSKLHATGALSDAEFAYAKQRLLQPRGPVPPPRAAPDTEAVQAGADRPPTGPAVRGATPAPRPLRAGMVLAAVGAGLTLVAFFALPMATFPWLGSITGARLAALGGAQDATALRWLWAIPVAASMIAVLAAARLASRPSPRHGADVAVVVLAVLTGLAYVFLFVAVQRELDTSGASHAGINATQFAGAGFWLALLGMVVAGIGGTVGLASSGGPARTAGQGPYSNAPVPTNGRAIVTASLIGLTVAALAGVAAWTVTHLSTADQTQSTSEGAAAPTSAPDGAVVPGPARTPSTDTASTDTTESSPQGDAAAFVEHYYGLLPANTDAGWALLSPQAQALSGGRQDYEDFWNSIRAVTVQNVQAVAGGAVQATVAFTRSDGSTSTEHYQLWVEGQGAGQVIQSFTRQSGGRTFIGVVDVTAVATDPRTTTVAQVLDAYFSGIDRRDYARALSAVDPSVVDASDPAQVATFQQNTSTSTDTDVTLTSIDVASDAPSGIGAHVTFQSTQDASLGPDGQACTRWNLQYLFSGSESTSLTIRTTSGTHAPC